MAIRSIADISQSIAPARDVHLLISYNYEFILRQTVNFTRVIAIIAGLLLFAGQLVSLVHATEHPFHDNSQICVSFISLEQHDIALSVTALAAVFSRLAGEVAIALRSLLHALPLYSSHARAPPLTT